MAANLWKWQEEVEGRGRGLALQNNTTHLLLPWDSCSCPSWPCSAVHGMQAAASPGGLPLAGPGDLVSVSPLTHLLRV